MDGKDAPMSTNDTLETGPVAAVNAEWLKAFPDPGSRPARHTQQNDHLPANMLVQCDVTAWAAD
jgi:2-iminobutanoate/2-iminopropanoate deaminase